MGVLRRLARDVRDTFLIGGLASMGGPQHTRTAMPLQTRALADALLPTIREEEGQSERARAVWSIVGAAALAGLGLLTLVSAWQVGIPFALLLGFGQVLVAGALALLALRLGTRGSPLNVAGALLAGVSILSAIFGLPLVSADWQLVSLLLALGALVGLIVGRR